MKRPPIPGQMTMVDGGDMYELATWMVTEGRDFSDALMVDYEAARDPSDRRYLERRLELLAKAVAAAERIDAHMGVRR